MNFSKESSVNIDWFEHIKAVVDRQEDLSDLKIAKIVLCLLPGNCW